MRHKKNLYNTFLYLITGIFFYCFILQPCFSQTSTNKWAVIIAINKYKDKNLLPLKYPESDASEFRKILMQYDAIPEDHIKTITGKEATRTNIKNLIYEYLPSKASPEDEIFIFFSGYGTFIKDDNGDEKNGLDECIIPYDGKISNPNGNYIRDDDLLNWLKAVKCRNIVLILDSEKSSGMDELPAREGILLITSSSYGELMREEKDLKGGTFMHFFIESIKKCETPGCSEISLLDVFENTKKKVMNYTKSRKYKQTPVVKGKISKKIVFTPSSGEEKIAGNLLFSSDYSGNQNIYILNGKGKVNLTEKNGINLCPVWSHDGEKIAFLSNRTGNFDIFVMNSNGTNQINLSDSPENNYCPSWSPDSSRLAYTSRVDTGESIFIINGDGTGKIQITNGKDWKDTKPLWSYDGSKIAFMSTRRGNNDIYTINPDTMELVKLTGNGLNISDFLWSPDGKYIAFIAKNDKKSDLYIMNSNGTMVTNLTNDNGTEYDFSWSHDGRKIAFCTTEYTENTANICIIDIDSGQKTSITSDGIWKSHLSWSDDSTKILFCSGTKAPGEIYEIKSDGTGLSKLVGGQGNNQEPSWKPVNEEK